MKSSLLDLHDKVSTLTFMLDTFMKEMKGMVVEDVVVEEEVDEGVAAMPQDDVVMQEAKEMEGEKEKEANEEQTYKEMEIPVAVDTTPTQTIPPTVDETTSPGKPKPTKKRKARSKK